MNAPNPFEPLGLPASWVPTAPVTWRLGNVELAGPAGALKLHVLVVDTPAGRIGVPLDDAGARALIDQLTAQCSGLHVARSLPPTNGEHQ